jgi:hypothetical protein
MSACWTDASVNHVSVTKVMSTLLDNKTSSNSSILLLRDLALVGSILGSSGGFWLRQMVFSILWRGTTLHIWVCCTWWWRVKSLDNVDTMTGICRRTCLPPRRPLLDFKMPSSCKISMVPSANVTAGQGFSVLKMFCYSCALCPQHLLTPLNICTCRKARLPCECVGNTSLFVAILYVSTISRQ